jgi:hypothetical protein
VLITKLSIKSLIASVANKVAFMTKLLIASYLHIPCVRNQILFEASGTHLLKQLAHDIVLCHAVDNHM